MSSVKELKGGLGNGQNNGAVLETVRKNLTGHKKVSLDFLKTTMAADKQKEKDGRIDRKALAEHVDDIADKTYRWVLDIARPFLRKLDQDVQDIGIEVLDDISEDSDESNAEQQQHYEERIDLLLSFSPENDKDIREELELSPERKKFFEGMFCRINDMARIALLVDDLRYAEEKDYLEHLLAESKNGTARVFARTKDQSGFKVFGQWYEVAEDVFGHYHDFAQEKLAEAASTRSYELAAVHNIELQKQKQEVSAKAETDVLPEQLLFGNPRDVNEKTALLSWSFQGHPNAIRLRRSGDRLYVISAIGKPNEALEDAQEELDDPFVSLSYILDKDREHLCHGKMEDNKPRYDFCGFIKRELFALTCWVRTAAGECLPDRLLCEDESRTVNDNNDSNGKHIALVDNDGMEDVDPEEFYFRTVNSGAGTLRINLPEGFILHLDEAKDENQELLAPERDVKTTKSVVVKIRRLIVDGRPKIVLDDCNDIAVMQELQINGIPGVKWIETGKKGWVGLPTPLPGILSFRYKLACESGEIKPNTKH
jgi:hypothetical protein